MVAGVRWVFRGCGLLCLSVAFSAVAGAGSNDQASIAAILSESGLETVIEQFPQLILSGIDQDPQLARRDDTRELKRIIKSAVDVEAMKQHLQRHLATGLKSGEVEQIRQWYLSDLGRKVVASENAASTPEAILAMNSEMAMLQKKNKGSRRESLFTQYDRATGATDSALEIALSVQKALVGAFAQNEMSESELARLVEMVEANRFMMRGLVGQQVYAGYLYVYDKLTDEELEQYIAFAQSPAGHHFFELTNEGVSKALTDMARTIGRNILNKG